MERCIICGAELPCETGTQYCRTCENKWLKIENEHIRQESVSQSVLKILLEEERKKTAKEIFNRILDYPTTLLTRVGCICTVIKNDDMLKILKEYGVEVDE